ALHRIGVGLALYEELQAAGIDPQGPQADANSPELLAAAGRRGVLFAVLTVLGTTIPATILISTTLFFRAHGEVPIWRLVVVSLGLTAFAAAAIALAVPRIASMGVAPPFIGALVVWLAASAAAIIFTARRRRSANQNS
ncbi:MAG: hypothetical protein R6U25_00115, partial [Alkalispirochaeta sp.]